MVSNFSELLDFAKKIGPKKVVIAGGDDKVSIKTIELARNENFVSDCILVGNKNEIEKLTKKFEIIDVNENIAQEGARIAKSIGALLMKGKITSPDFLRGVIQEMRKERRISHIAVIESSFYHKLLFITDGGINIRPDLKTKIDILLNAIDFVRKLGIDCPKIAILSASEKVNTDLPESVEAKELEKMGNEGKFGKCKIAGPIALDLAVSREAAKIKGIDNEVVGDADILLMPDVTTGNICCKGIQYLGGGKIGGVVVGALLPCIMLSRADNVETKINSIALAIACSV